MRRLAHYLFSVFSSVPVRRTKLTEHMKRLATPSVRKPPPVEVATQAVLDEVDKGGPAGIAHNGPGYIKARLRTDQTLLLPRCVPQVSIMRTVH